MAKFFGTIGFAAGNQMGTGIDEGVVRELPVIERAYYGDVIQNSKRTEQGTDINDDLTLSNRISIIADAYAQEHFFAMKYVNWMGARWKINHVEVQRPRLILTVGGVYNGPTPEFTS